MSYVEVPLRRSNSSALLGGLLFAFAGLLAFSPAPAGAKAAKARTAKPAAAPQLKVETASWAVLDAVTTIGFNPTLSALGLELTALEPSFSGHSPHPLSVAPPEAPSFLAIGPIGLTASVGADGFHGFAGGSLRHAGGFRLRGRIGTLDLSSFELRPGSSPTSLQLVDASGVALLGTAYAQWELDSTRGLLRYLNADLQVLPALAARLGDDRYAGVSVGVLDLDATLQVGAVPPLPPLPPGTNAIPPCGDWSGNVDVGLVNMSSIGQAGIATVNGRSVVVVLPSAELQNLGTANVPWYSKFTNIGNPPWNDQHPFLVWQMSRNNGGVLEPLGKSDLKHAFLTINSGCTAGACTDSHVLGIGCADVYGTSTNNSVGSLAPRSEVTASTGIWSHCGGIASHFDTNGDCVQDFSGSGENAFTHGLKAAESDLMVPGATYYVEAFYIVRNDINIFNSMGYRQVAPTKPGSVWSFPTVGAYSTGPAVNAWVNLTTPGAGNDNRVLDTGEGKVQLAVRTFAVPGSPTKTRYAYALQNHDFDRRIKSFLVPFDTAGVTIENITYVDGDGFAANDWTASVGAGGITWTAPAATTPPAEIDYATLVSFRFDADRSPATAQATLGAFEAGPTPSLQIQTLAPPGAALTGGSGFFTLPAPCRLLDTRTVAGGGPITSGNVRVVDVLTSGCGVPANATSLALNVIAVQPASSGDIAVYANDPPDVAASVISFGVGFARANTSTTQMAADGKVRVKPTLSAGGSTNVVIDIFGYFAPNP